MSKWLIVDTETTGLDLAKDVAIEIACVLWDSETKSVISAYSSLVRYPEPRKLSSEIEKITGIADELYQKESLPHD